MLDGAVVDGATGQRLSAWEYATTGDLERDRGFEQISRVVKGTSFIPSLGSARSGEGS